MRAFVVPDLRRARRVALWLVAAVGVLWPGLVLAQAGPTNPIEIGISSTNVVAPPATNPVQYAANSAAWRFDVDTRLRGDVTAARIRLSASDDVLLLSPSVPSNWTATAVRDATNPWRVHWDFTLPTTGSALITTFSIQAVARDGAIAHGATLAITAQVIELAVAGVPDTSGLTTSLSFIASADVAPAMSGEHSDTYTTWSGVHDSGGGPVAGRFFQVRRSVDELGNGAFGVAPGDNALTITLPPGAEFVGPAPAATSGTFWSFSPPSGSSVTATYLRPRGLKPAIAASGAIAVPVDNGVSTENLQFSFFVPCTVLDAVVGGKLGTWNDSGFAFSATHAGRTTSVGFDRYLVGDGEPLGSLTCADGVTDKRIVAGSNNIPPNATTHFTITVDAPAPRIDGGVVHWPEDVVIVDRVPPELTWVATAVSPAGPTDVYLCDQPGLAGTFSAADFLGFVGDGSCKLETATPTIANPTHVVVYRGEWKDQQDGVDVALPMTIAHDMQVRADTTATSSINVACASGFATDAILYGEVWDGSTGTQTMNCGRVTLAINSNQQPTVSVGIQIPGTNFGTPPIDNEVIRQPGDELDVYVSYGRIGGPDLVDMHIDVTLPPGFVADVGSLAYRPIGSPATPCGSNSATLTALGGGVYRLRSGVEPSPGCKPTRNDTLPSVNYAFVFRARLDPAYPFVSGEVDIDAHIAVVGPLLTPWTRDNASVPLTIEVPFQLSLEASARPCESGPTFKVDATITNNTDSVTNDIQVAFPVIPNPDGGADAIYDTVIDVQGMPAGTTYTVVPNGDASTLTIVFDVLPAHQDVAITVSYHFASGPQAVGVLTIPIEVSNENGNATKSVAYDLTECTGSLVVHKFRDLDGDGFNDREPALGGWSFDIGGQPSMTNGAGDTTFAPLAPGLYTVTEAPGSAGPGATLHAPKGQVAGGAVQTGTFTVAVYPGQTTVLEVGNDCTCADDGCNAGSCGFVGTTATCTFVADDTLCDDDRYCTTEHCVEGACITTPTCDTSVGPCGVSVACDEDADRCVEISEQPEICEQGGAIVYGVVTLEGGALRSFRCELTPIPSQPGQFASDCDEDLNGDLALGEPQCGE